MAEIYFQPAYSGVCRRNHITPLNILAFCLALGQCVSHNFFSIVKTIDKINFLFVEFILSLNLKIDRLRYKLFRRYADNTDYADLGKFEFSLIRVLGVIRVSANLFP